MSLPGIDPVIPEIPRSASAAADKPENDMGKENRGMIAYRIPFTASLNLNGYGSNL